MNEPDIATQRRERDRTTLNRTIATALLSVGIFFSEGAMSQPPSLRLVTINVWSGLDYVGALRMGEYERAGQKEKRFHLLVEQLKALDPGIIFLQEANPVSRFSSRLAGLLGYDEVHQVCNAGIKFGPVGIPWNIDEGIAILARPSLHLARHDVWKLSGGPGIHGDAVSIHFNESIFAMAAKITVDSVPMYVVGVHLVAALPLDSALARDFQLCLEKGIISKEEHGDAVTEWNANAERQRDEAKRLRKHLDDLPSDAAVIVGGDFNATLGSAALLELTKNGKFFDSFNAERSSRLTTWDPRVNWNIRFSTSFADSRGDTLTPYGILSALHDTTPRKIDHILLSNRFDSGDVSRSEVVIDSAADSLFASDHFGFLAEVSLTHALEGTPKEYSTVVPPPEAEIDALPIASYDTDAGTGYGAKVFFLDQLGLNESFDCVLFNSTKGERWYRLVFSLPDFELRQGKIFPLTFDLVVDYDKWISNSFFGIGDRSSFANREYYTREPLEITLSLSKGFSQVVVVQAGIRYKSVRNFGFSDTSTLARLSPAENSGTATYQSLILGARYDTRNSFVNPSLGTVLQGEVEQALHASFHDSHFTRISFSYQHYTILFFPTTVFALRCMGQGISGTDLPVQVLSSIGGNNTLRGSPQDRYLDNVSTIINAELRYPLYGRFGGVFGLDAGKVWHSVSDFGFSRWQSNPTAGLRFYMDTFVVRLDVGLGKETTGLYFNFGQIF